MKRLVLCISLLLVPVIHAANANSISKISNFSISSNTPYHISFDSNKKPTYKTLALRNRYVIDISNAAQHFSIQKTELAHFPVKDIRIGKKANHVLRIVFDLRVASEVKTLLLQPTHSHQWRIHITFKPLKNSSVLTTPASESPPKPKLRDIIVVLDPGHGGRDPGATGPRGTHEKKITLAIGLAVRHDLHKIPGIKVYMTRSRDVYPTLSQRLFLARRVKADVFVSIHADAFKRRSARGATVFALSQGRATSEAARWIAERENKSELLGGVDLADKSYTLRSVLVDLSQTATIDSSLKLGRNVLNNLSKITRMHSQRVEQASLYVLTSPDIPAILVETGFISNPTEERLLNTRSHQLKIAHSISEGIKKYLIDNPIQNTIFTARTFGAKYIVKKGDTLSGIAQKFNVSVKKLKQLNEIQKGVLVIGQVIRIPATKP